MDRRGAGDSIYLPVETISRELLSRLDRYKQVLSPGGKDSTTTGTDSSSSSSKREGLFPTENSNSPPRSPRFHEDTAKENGDNSRIYVSKLNYLNSLPGSEFSPEKCCEENNGENAPLIPRDPYRDYIRERFPECEMFGENSDWMLAERNKSRSLPASPETPACNHSNDVFTFSDYGEDSRAKAELEKTPLRSIGNYTPSRPERMLAKRQLDVGHTPFNSSRTLCEPDTEGHILRMPKDLVDRLESRETVRKQLFDRPGPDSLPGKFDLLV
jgi:hypothetical protein